jgi:quercetin dioxygenase-like cupin family protein
MKRTVSVLAVTLAVGIALGVMGERLLSAQQEPVKRTPMLQVDAPGVDGKELVLYLAEIAPGASSGKHFHPGPEMPYVLSGSITLEMEGQPAKAVKAGETLGYIPPKHVHEAKNDSATDPLKILVFTLHEKGQPLATRVTEPYFWKK